MHPIDLYRNVLNLQSNGLYEKVQDKLNIELRYSSIKVFKEEVSTTVIPLLFQVINFLGFVPYRSEAYLHEVYGKSILDLRDIKIIPKQRIQLAIHNLLHVTWLKRLESSMRALLKSVENYRHRIGLFEKWLNKGDIVSLGDVELLENEYGEDIERAFEDYEKYLEELGDALSDDKEHVKKYGIERRIADPELYNLEQLKIDLERDKAISNLLSHLLTKLSEEGRDKKLHEFAKRLANQIKEGKYGKKALVFSFFSDTIEYLKDALPPILGQLIPNFSEEAAFVSGNSKEVELIAKRFSPISKKHVLKTKESELNYLFATDVLSEGQNLQDAGILVNYDLHWNPVRMIQRNGRIISAELGSAAINSSRLFRSIMKASFSPVLMP